MAVKAYYTADDDVKLTCNAEWHKDEKAQQFYDSYAPGGGPGYNLKIENYWEHPVHICWISEPGQSMEYGVV